MIYRENTLCHYNMNHDPRNGQFTSASGSVVRSAVKASGVGTAAQLTRNKAIGTADAATRIPERVNHVKKGVALGLTGAALGASVAAAILAGPAAGLVLATGEKAFLTGFFSLYGAALGVGVNEAAKSLKDYMSGNTPDSKDVARYLRSNTRY